MRFKNFNKVIMGLAYIICSSYQVTAFADTASKPIQSLPTEYVSSTLTLVSYQKLNLSQQLTMATMWHLSISDYTHYLWLMENTPNRIYYQDRHLDPTVILGFNATSDSERKKYALLA